MNRDYIPDFSACVLPYVQWYQDDFAGGVRGMRANEIGIYTMLLMEMYARGKALDLSEDRLARLCGTDRRTFGKVIELLIDSGKIIRLDCGLWNDRCENAFRERAKMQEQQKSAARTSWENRRENNGVPERSHSERTAVAMPSSEAQKEERKKKEPLRGSDAPVEGSHCGKEKTLEAEVYAEGKRILGKSAGGIVTNLRKHLRGDWLEVLSMLRLAETKAEPMEWIAGVLRGTVDAAWERREAEIYAGLLQ